VAALIRNTPKQNMKYFCSGLSLVVVLIVLWLHPLQLALLIAITIMHLSCIEAAIPNNLDNAIDCLIPLSTNDNNSKIFRLGDKLY